jgi:hypothetical protein
VRPSHLAGRKVSERKGKEKGKREKACSCVERMLSVLRGKTSVPLFPVLCLLTVLLALPSYLEADRPVARSPLALESLVHAESGPAPSGKRDGDDRLEAARELLPARGMLLPKPTQRHAQAGEGGVGLAAVPARAMAIAAQKPAAQRLRARRKQREQKRVGQRRQQQQFFPWLPVPQTRTSASPARSCSRARSTQFGSSARRQT